MFHIACLALFLAALVHSIVIEHRITLEKRFQPLQKRVETCTSPGVGRPNGEGPGSTVCDPSQTCCYGGYGGFSVSCIPLDATCCTFVNAGGWCPSGRVCQEAVKYFGGLASMCVEPYTARITVAPESYTQSTASTPSSTITAHTSQERSSSSALDAGSIAGIVVSVVCSVLGLLFGIGFKIWKHRRKERREREQAAAAAQSAGIDGKDSKAKTVSS